MQNGSLVNTDNLALTIVQAAIRKALASDLDEAQRLAYVRAVKSTALLVKANQKLSQEQQDSLVKLIYWNQENCSTMGEMRKILRELGHENI